MEVFLFVFSIEKVHDYPTLFISSFWVCLCFERDFFMELVGTLHYKVNRALGMLAELITCKNMRSFDFIVKDI